MKTKHLLIAFLFICLKHAAAQPAIEWQKCIGGTNLDEINSMQLTTDGGAILAGRTNSNDGDVTGFHGGYNDCWVVKVNSAGTIQWQKCLGGTGYDGASSVEQTSDGGFIVIGSTDSNDGDVIGRHGAVNTDIWVVKLDSAGTIKWQKCLGGTSSESGYSIHQTTDGGFIVGGTVTSNDGDVSGNHGGGDYWVVKLDSVGTIQWQKCLGGTKADDAYSIKQTADAGFIVAGETNSIDGDVSGFHGGSDDFWVVKLDSIGTLQWQKCLGGTGHDYIPFVQLTIDGGYIVAGFTDSNDGDVSGNHGDDDIWIIKLNSAGNIRWQKCLGGTGWEIPYSVQQTPDSGFIIAGETESNDGDVSGFHGGCDSWIIKLDSIGTLLSQKCLGGTGCDEPCSIQMTTDGGLIVAGITDSNDGDVSGFHGGFNDCWIVKLTENYNTTTGKLYADFNSNQIFDGNDLPATNRRITEQNTSRFAFSDLNGNYVLTVLDSGSYSVIPQNFTFYNTIPFSQPANFSAINQIDSLNDFAFQAAGSVNDLQITLTPVTRFFRPGMNGTFELNYQNVGNSTLSGQVVFIADTNMTFDSSDITPVYSSLDSIVWSFTSLRPFQTGKINVNVKVKTTVAIGTELRPSARIEPVAGDATPPDNIANWELPIRVTASHDPNAIIVNRDTVFTNELSTPPYLEYIIFFQNTGNDTAFDIHVLNNIPGYLDVNTFEFVSASHPMSINYGAHSRLMDFHFNSILLPDSFVNEPASHGFIRYRIKPLSALVAGNNIPNYAAIYFDYNAPVVTDTANTKIAFPGEETYVINNSRNSVIIYPNPATNKFTISFGKPMSNASLKIFNIIGEEVYQQTVNGKLETVNSKLPSGIYFVELRDNERAYVQKLIVE